MFCGSPNPPPSPHRHERSLTDAPARISLTIEKLGSVRVCMIGMMMMVMMMMMMFVWVMVMILLLDVVCKDAGYADDDQKGDDVVVIVGDAESKTDDASAHCELKINTLPGMMMFQGGLQTSSCAGQ